MNNIIIENKGLLDKKGRQLFTMNITNNIKQQAQQILIKHTTTTFPINQHQLERQLKSILPTLPPTSTFPNPNSLQSSSSQPQIVYINLTVQDILDTDIYYSYLISKPIQKNSSISIFKYGINQPSYTDFNFQNYHGVIDQRDTIICLQEFYPTSWLLSQIKNNQSSIHQYFTLKISGNYKYKLGERIHALCVWNRKNQYLTFIRPATNQQIQQQQFNIQEILLKEEINYPEMRQLLEQSFNQFCSYHQTLMVIFCMISQQPMFINAHNISEQLSEILPRVNHLKIKAPFKQSLFPYKNSQGRLIQTPMQMALAKTFVIIDFSQFSSEKQVNIDQNQIDNLKALKVFVQQGKTIYRWQYGESLNDHIHSGIIVKGSKIITPHYYINQQIINTQKSSQNPFTSMNPSNKHKLRAYIQKCLTIKPKLSEHSRKQIENQINIDMKKITQQKLYLQQTIKIARLNAKSLGKEIIQFDDYQFAKKLINGFIVK